MVSQPHCLFSVSKEFLIVNFAVNSGTTGPHVQHCNPALFVRSYLGNNFERPENQSKLNKDFFKSLFKRGLSPALDGLGIGTMQ